MNRMAEQTPAVVPVAPAAPVTTPAAPSKPTFEQAYANTQRTPETPPVAAPTSAEAKRRLLHLKLYDNVEQDVDLEAEFDDEGKRAVLTADIQKGRNYDRAIERTRSESVEAARKQWNDWLASHNYDIVRDPAHASGWKLVARQPVTMPAAADTDPLTIEERDLQAKADADEASGRDLARLSFIRAERAEKRAYQRLKDEQTAQTQRVTADSAYEQAKGQLFGEIDTILGAHTKSFENLDRLKSRIRMDAFRAGETLAKKGASDDEVRAAAKAVVTEAVEDLTGREKKLMASLTTSATPPTSAPIVGTVPAGGTGPRKFKDIDEAFAAVEHQLSGKR